VISVRNRFSNAWFGFNSEPKIRSIREHRFKEYEEFINI